MTLRGDELPRVTVPAPGPASRELARRLAACESPNVTAQLPDPPIFWSEARGACVLDADGNRYIDLTAGFGVAHAGHANDAVAAAIATQAQRLAHGLGDVYPPAIKVELLERLAAIAPGDLQVSILASAGAEAVEAALKTAVMRTGRSGVIAFEGAYHGLTYGALALTHRPDFRAPFLDQLFAGVHFAPYPTSEAGAAAALEEVRRMVRTAETGSRPIGAIVIEPILGRGGLLEPPPGFLRSLRELCDGNRTLLIFDEVYTGCGRTGEWFACSHEPVVPDVLVIGKALTGSIPLSAAIGTPDAMSGWPASTGEAIHTSTFLGNPVACAAALAQLAEIERLDLLPRARRLGERIAARVETWVERGIASGRRGRGLLQGAVVRDAATGIAVARAALPRGVLVLAEGAGDVLAITPPAVITDGQLDHAMAVLENLLAERTS